jgi:hypothetical protein
MIRTKFNGGKMKSIEELKRERMRLISEAEVREDFRNRNLERKRLVRENRKLKHHRINSIKKGIFMGFYSSGKKIIDITKRTAKKIPKNKLKKITRNTGRVEKIRLPNFNFQ